MSNSRTLVASGQVGVVPIIYVWDALTAKPIKNYKLPKCSRGVTALAFNRTADLIAAADLTNDHNIYCFDWNTKEMKFKAKTGPNKILMIDWSLTSDTQFTSVGPSHIFFWNFADLIGDTVKPKAGIFG